MFCHVDSVKITSLNLSGWTILYWGVFAWSKIGFGSLKKSPRIIVSFMNQWKVLIWQGAYNLMQTSLVPIQKAPIYIAKVWLLLKFERCQHSNISTMAIARDMPIQTKTWKHLIVPTFERFQSLNAATFKLWKCLSHRSRPF